MTGRRFAAATSISGTTFTRAGLREDGLSLSSSRRSAGEVWFCSAAIRATSAWCSQSLSFGERRASWSLICALWTRTRPGRQVLPGRRAGWSCTIRASLGAP